MSRSYKKTPYCSCKKNKFAKNQANRKIRRNKDELYQNREFRKVYDSWDICDYGKVGISFEEYWRHIEAIEKHFAELGSIPYYFPRRKRKGKAPTREEAYKEWYLMYKRK